MAGDAQTLPPRSDTRTGREYMDGIRNGPSPDLLEQVGGRGQL